eukprot:7375993-Prymnesium_polylepis.1
MLTALPPRYPEGYSLPADANVAEYADRGWCFCESRWAMLTKDFDYTLDLGKLDGKQRDMKAIIIQVCTKGGARRPPITPEDFVAELQAKSFTNGKEDRPMVGELYRAAFVEEMGKAKELRYTGLGWGDEEMKALGKVVAMGALANLERLNLNANQIGDDGMIDFSRQIASGALPLLKVLGLNANQIGDD